MFEKGSLISKDMDQFNGLLQILCPPAVSEISAKSGMSCLALLQLHSSILGKIMRLLSEVRNEDRHIGTVCIVIVPYVCIDEVCALCTTRKGS